ncbi:energy transducer TonB [Aureibacter tunicatorum]|uniref:Protein TonB n=1 Tax=Aureibacter tunicatorum TaxID=866807 RepID=A0AAE4BPP6_9BACT|nr:TonB family protein [Aureibacter tunicatorum]MDR6238209.1 protein TonB [Aureibacter tunicatorum]BDD03242.1 hypothetical protein AUTU_07250 [Aureibacter tunicatorum]
MELKKNPQHNLLEKRNMFLGIGLCLSLGMSLVAMEWKSPYYTRIDNSVTMEDPVEETLFIQPTKMDSPVPPKPEPMKMEKPEPKPSNNVNIVVDEAASSLLDDYNIDKGDIDVIDDVDDPATGIEALPDEKVEDYVYFAEEMATFKKGGMKGFYKYISRHLKYPKAAKSRGIEGRVFVEFIIDKQGNLTNAKVLKGIDESCDAEALRVIKSSPQWHAAKQSGRAVKVKMTIPIIFDLK